MDMYIVIYAYSGVLCNNEKTTVIYHSRLNLTDIMLSKKSYIQKNTGSMIPFTRSFRNRQNQTLVINVRSVVIDRAKIGEKCPQCSKCSISLLGSGYAGEYNMQGGKRYSPNYSQKIYVPCVQFTSALENEAKIVMTEGQR